MPFPSTNAFNSLRVYLYKYKYSTLSIFHTFPATYHLALLMVCTFHSSLDMHDAAHIMISGIATSAWLIDFCHKAIYSPET